MTTAQILFEQYKVLPPRIRQELKKMIAQDTALTNDENEDDENSTTIRMSMKALKDSIGEVKRLKAGKQPTKPARELVNEVRQELANER